MKTLFNLMLILFALSIQAQNWQQISDFPGSARDDGTGFIIGDTAWFGTGLSPWWSAEADFYGLDLSTEQWFIAAALPAGKGRQYACGFSGTNQKGYIFGGINGSQHLNDLWLFDPLSNSWTEAASLPAAGRSGAACFVLNDTAYVVGGKTAQQTAIAEVWAYSILNDTWTQKSNLPFGKRWRASATVLNGLAYLLFGRDETGSFYNELHEYNPISDNWQNISTFPPGGRSHAMLLPVGGALYAGFGIDSLNFSHNDLWNYDVLQNTWIILPGLPALGRRGGMSMAYQNNLYYATGIDEGNQRLTEVWKHNPALSLDEQVSSDEKILLRIIDMTGRQTSERSNTLLIYLYSDGTSEKIYRVE